MLFTFVTSKEGSVNIEQLEGEGLREVASRWYNESITEPGEPLEGMEDPTPVSGVQRVWCIGGIDPRGRFYWAHIVETKR